MRKKCKIFNEYEWHEWFAWYPIWVKTGNFMETCIWMERVQRRFKNGYIGDYTEIRNLDGSDIE